MTAGQSKMSDVLLGQGYYLKFDPKLWAAMEPYPPLGALYAAAGLRDAESDEERDPGCDGHPETVQHTGEADGGGRQAGRAHHDLVRERNAHHGTIGSGAVHLDGFAQDFPFESRGLERTERARRGASRAL